MSAKDSFRLGSLYPTLADGAPNLILSSGYQLDQDDDGYVVRSRAKGKGGKLKADLRISTDAIELDGVSAFASTWLQPQLLAKDDPHSIFRQYHKAIVEIAWPTGAYPNNLLLEALSYLGYRGYGWDKVNDNTGEWKEKSTDSGLLYASVQDLNNYKPELIWGNIPSSDRVVSAFDTEALLANLAHRQGVLSGEPPLWLPSMLFTYGISGSETSYPGPVLMIQPGEKLDLHFSNDISIPGLSEQQNQQATLVANSSYGLNGGATAGGMFSANFHLHGGHVTPTGFGDNVVSRFTSGQNWTTSIKIPKDHGHGSNWYHPHYHPAVNTQLYGGLSGFMQVGDPLQKIPFFKDVPRNLAVLKTMQIEVNPQSNQLELAALNGNILGTQSLAPNRASMFTVNGEYMPSVDFEAGGWQALTLSNQDNNYYMNLSIRHQQEDGSWQELPLYLYGEDGHQYPQIRAASAGALGYAITDSINTDGYAQAQDLISLPSGKRVDILFYLPSGQSELVSSYRFVGKEDQPYEINNLRFPSGQYVDLSSSNVDPLSPLSGPGPVARFRVGGSDPSPSRESLNKVVRKANQGIEIQTISPQTEAQDYRSEAVPSVNLYAENRRGREKWQPVRQREFNYEVLALVGPEDQRDIPTQRALAAHERETGQAYQTYSVAPTDAKGTWLGYENPDFINDHVFPNGPLIIAQLGTMEEWSLKNWNWGGPSVPNGGYLVGHPFHIHINDYQVKQSDTELANKRNLEDVTMLNSSGYHYADKDGVVQKLDPLVGSFTPIPEAFAYTSDFYSNGLFTTGYTDTTIRMLFQDFLGTYVHHCHLLEHEDAGMMQVVTVIENTDSSFLVEAEGFRLDGQGLQLRRADSLAEIRLRLEGEPGRVQRAQVGDLTADFVQDILLGVAGDGAGQAGRVDLYDGSSLIEERTSKRLASFIPYANSSLAPWAYNSDFTGDGKRELVTAGFSAHQGNRVALNRFAITGWLPSQGQSQWKDIYKQNPWQGVADVPADLIPADLTSFTLGDFNLDNFDDYAVAYLANNQLRVRLIDGAAISLLLQTGVNEGGYLPGTAILSDMTYSGSDFSGIDRIVLTTGFNTYAQSPIENLIVTASSPAGHSEILTFQLDVGHFIATGTDSHDADTHSLSASHHGGAALTDSDAVANQGPLPLHLTNSQHWHGELAAATPTFNGVLGQGSLLLEDQLVIGQGTTSGAFSTGNRSSSALINNTTQQLFVGLQGIERVSRDDLTGIVNTDLTTRLAPGANEQRLNLTMLAVQAYTNRMVKPSDLAGLAAGEEGGSLSVSALTTNILSRYSTDISAYYGGPLEEQSTSAIVQKAFATLYQRRPSGAELARWSAAVDNGMARSQLPMAILQNSSGADARQVALLSAATRWTQTQWGTSAAIDGSFGQGLQADLTTYDTINKTLFTAPAVSSWREAQTAFDGYRDRVINLLDGTPVSDTGFF